MKVPVGVTPMEVYMNLQNEVLSTVRESTGRDDTVYVRIQMGICSQAAGVLEVLEALKEVIDSQKFKNVVIKKTGCAGLCAYEPLVTLEKKGNKPVTYCRVTPEQARVLLAEYVLRGRIIKAWTLSGKDVRL